MAFNSYEELKAAVDSRRSAVLTMEVEIGSKYSQEYEDAKKELAQAKGMQAVLGGVPFLGDTNLEEFEAKVARLKPEAEVVYVQYRQLDLAAWGAMIRKPNMTPLDQYESVLVDTFIGVYGQDPEQVDEFGNEVEVSPLSTNAALVSSKGLDGILPGPLLHSVVQTFMAWQNSGGDVTIRPTKSGRA